MKNLLLFCLLIITTQVVYGQSDTVFIRYNGAEYDEDIKYQVDTVVYPSPMYRQILHGTTILPSTENQQIAKNYGLYLEKVTITPCDSRNRPPRKEEVTAIIETDSTLLIELKIIGNCCHEFLCDVQILEERIINLIQYGYGSEYCSCDCCFGLTYHFSTIQTNGYSRLNAVIIDGVMSTKKAKK